MLQVRTLALLQLRNIFGIIEDISWMFVYSLALACQTCCIFKYFAFISIWINSKAGFLWILSVLQLKYVVYECIFIQVYLRFLIFPNFIGQLGYLESMMLVMPIVFNASGLLEFFICSLLVAEVMREAGNLLFIYLQYYFAYINTLDFRNKSSSMKYTLSVKLIKFPAYFLGNHCYNCLYRLIFYNMGTVCSKPGDVEPAVEGCSNKSNRIVTNIHDPQSEKINQIKQFLTLSAQNTRSFYSRTMTKNLPDQVQEKEKDKKTPKAISDFKVVRGLGKGAFGQVFMVKDKKQNKFYAMKIICKSTITCSQQKINTLSQRFILEAMDHPFIVKLHYAFQSQQKLYLLCDLMSGGELFYLLRRNKSFPQEVAKFYAAEILLAIEYLHSHLKPENILLDQHGHIKITDFGLSKVCNSGNQVTYSICGTPQYVAPEVMLGKGYSQTADWFSFGSLLYDMLTGKPPFYSVDKNQMLKKIASKPVPIPEQLSPAAKSLLKGLFKIKPKQRLGFLKDAQQIKSHEFFANVNFEQVYLRKVDAPISFKQTFNDEGFDVDFNNNSYQSTINLDRTIKEKGLIFDGFTYYKPQIPAIKKEGEFQHSAVQFQHSP